MKEKLMSRKFWAMIIGVIMGVAMAFGVDASEISEVAGAMTSLVSLVVYMYTEGKIDAAKYNSKE